MKLTATVPAMHAGTPLVEYLTRRFTYHSFQEWADLIRSGRVILNDRQCLPETLIEQGDVTTYEPQEFQEPVADLNYRIVYEDQWLLGVDKPGNLLVHRAGKAFKHNLIYQLRFGTRPYPEAGIVNRLDRETSGVVLVAKSKDVLAFVNNQLARGRMEKEYLAVVSGCPGPGTVTIDLPLGPAQLPEQGYVQKVDVHEGKPAQTVLTLLRRVGECHSLIKAQPLTGRTHQIRVHCSAMGWPIVGDRLYGGARSDLLQRQALHCCALSLSHPISHLPLRIEAPLPQDMEQLLARLDGEIS